MNDNNKTSSAIDFSIRAKTYESVSSWVKSKAMNDVAKGYFKNVDNLGHVLDAGGGTGFLSSYILKDSKYESLTIVDGSKEMLSIASSRHPYANIICDSIEHFGINSTIQYNTIFCRQVLHYVDDVDTAIKSIKLLLDPAGLLYIGQFVFPNTESQLWHRNITSRISQNRKRTFEKNSFIQLFLDLGFEIIRTDFTSYEENLYSFYKRRIGDVDYNELFRIANETLTDNIKESLQINLRTDNIYYNIKFCHLLLRKMYD